MTTAPDLPLHTGQMPAGADASFEPYPAEPARPALTVVPAQPADDDAIAFDEALRKAGPRLKRYAARRLRDEHEAEEVVQEALLRGFQHRHLLATEDDLMAWLTVVTGRLVIDRLRVRGRSTPVAELPPTSRTGRDTADVVVARDEARLALDALEAMPGRQASVLWAREVEGLSYDEIGDRFSMSEPSVRSLLHRARRTLRREYAERGGTLPAVGLIAFAPWLRGLRAAGRVRHVARRGASATAVAATGLVIATVVPFGAHSTPARAPSTAPAMHINADTRAAHEAHHVARRTAHTAPVVQQHAAQGAATPTSVRLAGPALCGGRAAGHDIAAGCQVHHAPTVNIKLPFQVAGYKKIGVSNDSRICKIVPTTPLTECRNPPSKGSAR
jgi:RNA polymerase sigma-70 factor (ECF subfamily)